MKSIILVLSLFSLTTFAQSLDPEPAGRGKSFEERKAEALKRAEKRIADMTENKNCIAAATDGAGLKACHKEMREKRKANRLTKMNNKIDRMKNRRDRMRDK